jgi:hypothetical protein
MLHLQPGDLSSWFTAIGTVGTLCLVSLQANQERVQRRRERETDQASHVSSWVAKEQDDKVWLAIYNQSKAPIYEVVISIVPFHGDDKEDPGKETPNEYRDYLSVVPPGKFYGYVKAGYSNNSFLPGVEIAFKDIGGLFWLRHRNGTLERLHEHPMQHYRLPTSIRWRLAEEDLPTATPQTSPQTA